MELIRETHPIVKSYRISESDLTEVYIEIIRPNYMFFQEPQVNFKPHKKKRKAKYSIYRSSLSIRRISSSRTGMQKKIL